MANPIRNKKVVIPALIGLGFLVVVFTVISPLLAEAQTSTNDQKPTITGSVNVAQAMKDYIKENQKTSFSDAASIAEKQVTNGVVVGGHIGVVQGYLVYNFVVLDTENETAYFIVIDAGDGKLLQKSDGTAMKDFGKSFGSGPFGHGQFGKHGFGGGWMMPHQGYMDKTGSESPESQTP